MRSRFDRLLAELAPEQSYEMPVVGEPRASEPKKRKKNVVRAMEQAMAEAEGLLMEVTRKKAARCKCSHDGCQKLADKGLVWADGRGVVLCCSGHEEWARKQIEVKNKDEVATVWDLAKERRAQGL